MAASDDLFLLINSLTKSEKGYLKKYAYKTSKDGDADYWKLFDLIDKQKEYDESVILKRMAKSKLTKQFSASKYYLFGLIMSCLREYTKSGSKNAQYYTQLEDLRVLAKKGLYDQAFKIHKKLKRQIDGVEKFEFSLLLGNWEDDLLHATGDIDGIEAFCGEPVDELIEITEKIKNYWELRRLCMLFFVKIRKNMRVRDEKIKQEMEEIMSHPLLQSDDAALSFKAKNMALFVKAKYYRSIKDYENSLKVRKEQVRLVDENDFYKKLSQLPLIRVRSNLANMQIVMGRYAEALESIDKIEEITPDTHHERLNQFTYGCLLNMELIRRSASYVESLGKVKQLIEQFEGCREEIKEAERIMIEFHFATYHLAMGMAEDALDWITQVTDHYKSNVHGDVIAFGMILNLLIHFELNNSDHIEYAMRSAVRYLKTREKLHKVEQLFLNFLRRSPKFYGKKERLEGFIELKEQLIPLEKEEYESNAFRYFDLISWLESKISGRPFVELARDRRIHIHE